jgi:hypothetical protein
MQATLVLLMALGGMGCHNKSCDMVDARPTFNFDGGGYANAYSGYLAPRATPAGYSSGYIGGYRSADLGWRAGLRDTLFSFVLGRSPDVPTPREIEASVYTGRAGH